MRTAGGLRLWQGRVSRIRNMPPSDTCPPCSGASNASQFGSAEAGESGRFFAASQPLESYNLSVCSGRREERSCRKPHSSTSSACWATLAGQDPLKLQAAAPKKTRAPVERRRRAEIAEASRARTNGPSRKSWRTSRIPNSSAAIASARSSAQPGTPIIGVRSGCLGRRRCTTRSATRANRSSSFCALRESNLALLKSLTPEQWKHHGMHSERGTETVEHIARMMAGHDINHFEQIERILAPKKK